MFKSKDSRSGIKFKGVYLFLRIFDVRLFNIFFLYCMGLYKFW